MARRSTKSKTQVKVNFKGVESFKTPPEGDYKVKVLEATMGKSQADNDQIEATLEISEGKFKGTKLWMYFPLQENSLWKLHAFLTALGMEVPDDDMDIDLSDLVDEELVGVLTHETYKGKKRAKMTDFDSLENYKGSADEDGEDDDAGEKGKKKKDKKGKKNKDKGADTGEKSKKDKKSKDEPEEKSSKKSKDKAGKKDKKAKKYAKSDVEDMDEDELQAIVDKHDLDDVELDDHKKIGKKRAAVIEALEEADLLEDDE